MFRARSRGRGHAINHTARPPGLRNVTTIRPMGSASGSIPEAAMSTAEHRMLCIEFPEANCLKSIEEAKCCRSDAAIF